MGGEQPGAATARLDQVTQDDPAALLVVSLAGVQRFIAQRSTTADLWGASTIASRIARHVRAAVIAGHDRATVIIPVPTPDPGGTPPTPAVGVTNRMLVALDAAAAVDGHVRAVDGAAAQVWRQLLAGLFGAAPTEQVALVPTRARWVVVGRAGGDNAGRWGWAAPLGRR